MANAHNPLMKTILKIILFLSFPCHWFAFISHFAQFICSHIRVHTFELTNKGRVFLTFEFFLLKTKKSWKKYIKSYWFGIVESHGKNNKLKVGCVNIKLLFIYEVYFYLIWFEYQFKNWLLSLFSPYWHVHFTLYWSINSRAQIAICIDHDLLPLTQSRHSIHA